MNDEHQLIPQFEQWKYSINQRITDKHTIKNEITVENDEIAKNPLLFLHFFMDNFREYLDLTDTIMLTGVDKSLAYKAYNLNCSRFGIFCDEVWEFSLLNFNLLGSLTDTQFINIQQRFNNLESQSFPLTLPIRFIKYLRKSTSITFHLAYTPILPPRLRCCRNFRSEIRIVGGRNYSSFQFRDIMLSFPRTKCLEMHAFHFEILDICILRTFILKKLTLTTLTLEHGTGYEFYNALERSKSSLEFLRIETNENFPDAAVNRAIIFILSKIDTFKNLKHLRISTVFTHQNISNLFNILRLLRLETLKIIDTNNTIEERTKNHFLRIFANGSKAKIEIV